MSRAIENLQAAEQRAIAILPKVGGFPYLAESLRQAGVTRNFWFLPACQSLYLTHDGPVVTQSAPLLSGIAYVPPFDREALIRALRIDQAESALFQSSSPPRGGLALSGTMSILQHARSPTTAATVRIASRATCRQSVVVAQVGWEPEEA